MTRTLEQEVLEILGGKPADGSPVTLGWLARRLGVSSALMTSCAQQMVAKGLAEPARVTKQGVPTLHGLLPQQVVEPKPEPAAEIYS